MVADRRGLSPHPCSHMREGCVDLTIHQLLTQPFVLRLKNIHDESIFYVNADQSFHWTDADTKYIIESWRSDLKCFLFLFFNMSAKVQQEYVRWALTTV